MSSKRQWTDELRDRLSRYESKDVPQGLWDDIERALDAKPRRGAAWIRLCAAAAAVAAVCVCGVGMLWKDNAAEEVVAEKRRVQQTERRHQQPLRAVQPEERQTAMTAMRQDCQERQGQKPVTYGENVVTQDETAMSGEAVIHGGTDPKSGSAREPVTSPRHDNDGNGNRLLADYSGQQPQRAADERGGGLSVGLYASNITSSSSNAAGYGTLSDSPMLTKAHGVAPIISPAQAVAYSNRYEEAVTDVKHHLPVRIGVGARYFINRRWAVETGIVYSMLESEIKSGTGHSYIYNNQKIQYVGVPLAVGYQWLNTGRLTVYTNMGVLAEFGADGRLESRCVVDGSRAEETCTDIGDIPVQWSLSAAAGVQYNIIGGLGIFAEPGVAYYIDNSSSLQTAYSDKPFNFSMKVGLRYDFKSRKSKR